MALGLQPIDIVVNLPLMPWMAGAKAHRDPVLKFQGSTYLKLIKSVNSRVEFIPNLNFLSLVTNMLFKESW